jgi:hypothetical protein
VLSLLIAAAALIVAVVAIAIGVWPGLIPR